MLKRKFTLFFKCIFIVKHKLSHCFIFQTHALIYMWNMYVVLRQTWQILTTSLNGNVPFELQFHFAIYAIIIFHISEDVKQMHGWTAGYILSKPCNSNHKFKYTYDHYEHPLYLASSNLHSVYFGIYEQWLWVWIFKHCLPVLLLGKSKTSDKRKRISKGEQNSTKYNSQIAFHLLCCS